ncbi:MAG TPA: DUF5680 domain-containing protein [Candidatus Bathyarchaeia archaeon]|nr:DUF5680 domain-containing protein [Candidatus Bathyarchaeia archaeon]
MKKEELRKFILESNKAGYASGEEKKWIKEKDKSISIPFKKGDWRMHDNFFGGEPYGGRIIVSLKNKPVWMMVYYGWVAKGMKTDLVYKVLREALAKMPEKYPFCGPKKHKEENFVYENKWKGNLEEYSGEEKIIQNKKIIYKANYLGGLVDQRRGI